MTYPAWWERLAAALVDWLITTVFVFAFSLIFSAFAWGNVAALRIFGFLAMIGGVVILVGYKVLFEASALQATPGKLAFGLKVAGADGQRPGIVAATVRTLPWFLYLITALTQLLFVGYWVHAVIWFVLLGVLATALLPPGGRAIHDRVSGLHVIKTGGGVLGGRPKKGPLAATREVN